MEALPRKFGRYRLTALLGRGGQASVFRGESEPVAGVVRSVAIKRIHQQDEDAIRLLAEEARIWVKLQHPNIVTVIDFGEEDGDWFLALELVDGMSALALLERQGPLPAPLALCIAERVARALGHAHALTGEDGQPGRVVHRDVKPGNILLSRKGVVKLSDFGIARGAFRTTRTQAGWVKGSVGYFSPEQARGEAIDGRSDLFSLGCTLFELMTGRTPVPSGREEAMRAAATGAIERPPTSIPIAVRELLASLLEPRPENRPRNADDVARQIRALIAPEDPDDLAAELGRRVTRTLEASGGAAVIPEDAPSLAQTAPAEKTRISKAPVAGDPPPQPRGWPREPSKTVPHAPPARAPLPPPPASPAPEPVHVPIVATRPAAGPTLRDLMLPIAGVAVAIGTVIAMVVPHGKESDVVRQAAPATPSLERLLSPAPARAGASTPQSARAQIAAFTRDVTPAVGRFRVFTEARNNPDDTELVYQSFRYLADTDLPAHRETDIEITRKLAVTLGRDFIRAHPDDSRAASVRVWVDEHD